MQKHVDQAVSKTCNIPHDYPVEDLSAVWLEFLPKLKGTTFYRESSRGYVNKETGKTEAPPLKAMSIEDAKKILDKQIKVDTGVAEVNDCPKGICSI